MTANSIYTQFREHLGSVTLVVMSLAVALGGCDPNLDVDNPNQPGREEVLASGANVESLIVSSFNAYHDVANGDLGGVAGCGGATAWTAVLNALADHSTSNWANYGFADTAGQPRSALPNSFVDPNACLMTTPWFRAYQGLAAVAEGFRAMDAGTTPASPERARAWGRLMQGHLHGLLAIMYDRAFIVDETVQIIDDQGNTQTPELSSYQAMKDTAIGYLERAIEIAENNDFTTPAAWTNGRAITNEEMAELAHSYIARYRARWPRNPSEAEQVDWAAVEQNLRDGHDFHFTTPGTQEMWSGLEIWTEWGGTFVQLAYVDNKTVGPADTSGAYQEWLNAPVAQSAPFDVHSPDQRIPKPEPRFPPTSFDFGCFNASFTGPAPDAPDCGMANSYIGYHSGTYMPRARGLIGLSHYTRYEQYFGVCSFVQIDFTADGPVCDFTLFDKDMLMAEALWRQGEQQAAADILNEYRDGAGIGDVGPNGVSGDDCVPRMPNGDCADFIHTLAYEKGLAVSSEHSGDMWADKRRWGMLTEGTAAQMPIPAKELETLGMQIYTFGGASSGSGNVVPSSVPVIKPGDKESILKKVNWSLNVLEAQRLARQGSRPLRSASKSQGPPTIAR